MTQQHLAPTCHPLWPLQAPRLCSHISFPLIPHTGCALVHHRAFVHANAPASLLTLILPYHVSTNVTFLEMLSLSCLTCFSRRPNSLMTGIPSTACVPLLHSSRHGCRYSCFCGYRSVPVSRTNLHLPCLPGCCLVLLTVLPPTRHLLNHATSNNSVRPFYARVFHLDGVD